MAAILRWRRSRKGISTIIKSYFKGIDLIVSFPMFLIHIGKTIDISVA